MTTSDQTPTFNMKVVVQETGLKPDTLRAWERRYGKPNPQRTEGGHRLYSQYEIDMLKWLIERQDEGLSISHAVELWEQIKTRQEDPFVVHPLVGSEQSLFTATLTGDSVELMRKAWLAACLDFDEQQAQHIIAEAFAVLPLETVCFEILQKGLRAIGDGWYTGTITVQQEHFTSALAVRHLESLLTAAPLPTRNGRILIACPPLEQHTFSPLLLSVLLRRRGWDVIYLGANVPLDQIETAVQAIKPQILVTSAQTLTTAGTTHDMAMRLAATDIPLAFGGGIFITIPQLHKRIPGYYLGQNFATALSTIEKLKQTTPEPLSIKTRDTQYQTALIQYRENRAPIEAQVQSEIPEGAMPLRTLHMINAEFGNNIIAALTLEDIALLDSGYQWIRGLLNNHLQQTQTPDLPAYFQIYHDASQQYLNSQADMLLDWLATAVSR